MDQPTWKKYVIMRAHVERISVFDKRLVFRLMFSTSVDELMPHLGITFGEFAIWQVHAESTRKHTAKERAKT